PAPSPPPLAPRPAATPASAAATYRAASIANRDGYPPKYTCTSHFLRPSGQGFRRGLLVRCPYRLQALPAPYARRCYLPFVNPQHPAARAGCCRVLGALQRAHVRRRLRLEIQQHGRHLARQDLLHLAQVPDSLILIERVVIQVVESIIGDALVAAAIRPVPAILRCGDLRRREDVVRSAAPNRQARPQRSRLRVRRLR